MVSVPTLTTLPVTPWSQATTPVTLKVAPSPGAPTWSPRRFSRVTRSTTTHGLPPANTRAAAGRRTYTALPALTASIWPIGAGRVAKKVALPVERSATPSTLADSFPAVTERLAWADWARRVVV